MAKDYPYCTQCYWNVQAFFCANPKQGRNLVTGEARIMQCWYHRNNLHIPNSCHAAGDWFEPKEDSKTQA